MTKQSEYTRKYNQSERGKAVVKAYRCRPEVKARALELARLRERTPAGRTARAVTIRKYQETPNGRSQNLWNSAKHRADKLGLAFDITPEWVQERIAAGRCEVTGLLFTLALGTGRRARPWNPSLDRKNPLEGYTQQNTQVVVWAYNTAKGGWTHDEVLALANALVGCTCCVNGRLFKA
jgi:hypothetical protein